MALISLKASSEIVLGISIYLGKTTISEMEALAAELGLTIGTNPTHFISSSIEFPDCRALNPDVHIVLVNNAHVASLVEKQLCTWEAAAFKYLHTQSTILYGRLHCSLPRCMRLLT